MVESTLRGRLRVELKDVVVDGCTLRVHLQGSGPAVLLLHGSASTSGGWAQNVEMLSQRFTCIFPDLPACGRSSTPPQFWTVARHARAFLSLLSELGCGRASWVGHSFGALVAAEAAAQAPESVERLVLVAPPPVDDVLGAATILTMLRLIGEDGVAQFSSVEHAGIVSPFANPLLVGLANRNLACSRWFYQTLAAVANYPAADRLPLIRCKILMLWGAQDGIVAVGAEAGWLQSLKAPVASHVMQKAGHTPQFDAPLVFNPLVRRFLSRPDLV